jgi:hypothetical protein
MSLIEVTLREPTPDELKIGRGEPSGNDGQWRVLATHLTGPLIIHYPDKSIEVTTGEHWNQIGSYGVQAITLAGHVLKNADEYRWQDNAPKFGKYIDDDQYQALIERVCRG